MTDDERSALERLKSSPRFATHAFVTSEAAREFIIENQGVVSQDFSSWDIALEELGADVVKVSLKERR